MTSNSSTREYQEIVQISNLIYEEYTGENFMWENSPFKWIKHRPSRSIGAIGEKIIASWLAMHNFNVTRSPDSNADRIVEGKRVEIKFSTLWKSGDYKFQQLRDQNYDFVIMLGISPNDAHCWVVPKQEIIRLWKVEKKICSQHGGASGSDTAWVNLTPDNTFKPLAEYGNSLSGALLSITELTGYSPKSFSSTFDN